MDRTEWMFEVEVNRLHIVEGNRTRQWVIRNVAEVNKGDEVRCVHCQGDVQLHQGDTVRWHAQHRNADDAERCPGSPHGKEKKHLTLPPGA